MTNSQYALFIQDDGYSRQAYWSYEGWNWVRSNNVTEPSYWRNPDFNAPNQPVVMVTWWEAEAFCKWAGVRLPKADEAEAAARGSRGSKYPWGDTWEDGVCNSSEAGLGSTSAVGIFARDESPFDAMDMAGNVYEWCDDGDATRRAIQGGSWRIDARGCRAAGRFAFEPQYRGRRPGLSCGRGFTQLVQARPSKQAPPQPPRRAELQHG